ncbi:MAG TPA: ABC transporter permease, partial [Thermoanaerobaculia bacterium]|nr:ABC transporter permease [Thermoanaerobaculia bacterium]
MILDIARHGWLMLRRDRAALILSFIVPVVFFSIFASIFGGRDSSTPKVRLAVVDLDLSKQSERLIAALDAESAIEVRRGPDAKKQPGVRFDAATAEQYVRGGSSPAALIIPKGFGETPVSFGPSTSEGPKFKLISDSSDPIAANVVSGLLQKVVMTSMPDTMIRSGMDAMDRFGGGLTPEQRTLMQQNIEAVNATDGSSAQPNSGSLVNMEIVDVLGETKKSPLVAFYAAGIGVMFLLFAASGAGGVLLEEQESGTLDRILSTRVTMSTLLFGKLLYLWSLAVVQLLVMFIWGALVFKLELLSHLAGFAIMTAVTAFACSTFGLALAAVARTRQQLSALSTL